MEHTVRHMPKSYLSIFEKNVAYRQTLEGVGLDWITLASGGYVLCTTLDELQSVKAPQSSTLSNLAR